MQLPCPADNCNKKLKSQGNLMRHVGKFHESVMNLLSPGAGSSSIRAPPTAPLSTPGPSRPPAPTMTPTPTNAHRQLFSPGTEAQLQVDEELLIEAAKEEDDLYEAIKYITQNVIDPEKELEIRGNIQNKLERYKNIMMKKDKLIKTTMEKSKSLQLSVEAMKHDAAMRNQVEERANKRLEELLNENETLTKGIKTQRARNKDVLINDKLKKKENNKLTLENKGILIELENIRDINGKLNKDNSDLTIRMKTKEKLVQSLQEALGIEDAEEAEVEEVASQLSEDPVHECNACNRKFKTNPDLERHIQAKHTEYSCTYCDKLFSSEAALARHHAACEGLGPANSRCNKCNKNFTTQGLKRHDPTCHGSNKFECTPCGEIFKSSNELKKHTEEEHDLEIIKSRVVCKHWRKGHCTKGLACLFSHVGRQNEPITTSKTTTRVPACSNGAGCEWLARGSCSYFHPRVGVQKPWNRTVGRQDTRPS